MSRNAIIGIIAALAIILIIALLVSADRDRGNPVRDAYDNTRDAARDAGDALRDTTRDAVDATQEAAGDTKRAVQDAAD